MKKIIWVLAIYVMLISGCAASWVPAGSKPLVPLTLQEADLYRIVKNAEWKIAGGAPDKMVFGKVVSLTFVEPDVVQIAGKRIKPNGDQLDGSYDLKFAVENGTLTAQIVAFTGAEFDLASSQVRALNAELRQVFADAVTQVQGKAATSVRVTGGDVKTLKIMIEPK